MKRFALTMAFAVSTSSAFGSVEIGNGFFWKYYIENGEAWISGADPCSSDPDSDDSGNLPIPAVLGGCPVRRIGNSAFSDCSELKSVSIPGSVAEIGNSAFYSCIRLESLTISDGVKTIGDSSFQFCSSLTFVKIPGSVKTIGNHSFYECSWLDSVTIENGVKHIGPGAFMFCHRLASVTIPDGVTSIGNEAFYCCDKLESITIPDSVTSIGKDVFVRCVGLRTLSLSARFKGRTSTMGIPSGCTVVFRPDVSPPTYAVRFSSNGGKLPAGKKMPAQELSVDKPAKLRKNVFERTGYVFIGWSRTKTGAVAFKNAASVENLANAGQTVTLYAQWAKKSYKVAFYANGGTGKMTAQKMTYGKSAKLKTNKFKKKGCVFKGWAKSKALAKKGKVAYKNKKSVKDLVKNGKTVKLFAVWKKK